MSESARGGSAARLRILLVAENISLTQSGETSVPYYYLIKFLALGIEVQVLCHPRVREELRNTLPPGIFTRLHFVAESKVQAWLWRCGKFFHYRIADLVFNQLIYLLSQLSMRRLAARIVQEKRLNLVFQPVPISPKTPSYMYGLGVPVVIGPMCGGLELPPGFRHMDGVLVGAAIRVARALTPLLHRLIPGKLQAATLIVGNHRTAVALPRGVRGDIHEVVESGVDFARWEPKTYPVVAASAPTKFIFCGRLVDWKGAHYLVEAFGQIARKSQVRLDIIGDGELHATLAKQIAREGLGDVIQLWGRVPLAECIGLMRDADVYVMPSLRECGGLALLEAMALGLPIVACNWMGPAEYLNAECAILVDPDSESTFVQGLAAAMLKLANDPALRRRLGEHARKRVYNGYYDWDKKVARVAEILDATLARQSVS